MLENGKIIIEVYREKKPEDFTKLLADKTARIETGSAAALTAAQASALAQRAAAYALGAAPESERLCYIARNLEILRGYMINLIDEDVKCRAPMRKAVLEGGALEIDACRHPACEINEEIIGMMLQLLSFASELSEVVPESALHYLGESVTLCRAAMDISRSYILNMVKPSRDETYKYVTRRENEISFSEAEKIAGSVLQKVNAAIN